MKEIYKQDSLDLTLWTKLMFDCFRTSYQWFSFASPIHPLNSSIHSLNCLSKVRSGGLAST